MKILYIGGFELPDKNAAAHRVMTIGKIFRDLGHSVYYIGITKDKNNHGSVDNFKFEAIDYPHGLFQWIKYISGYYILIKIRHIKPQLIIAYNYPAFAICLLILLSNVYNYKVIGDITEWYEAKKLPRKIDTFLCMNFIYKKLDGIITISNYLYNHFSKQDRILIPPLVDLQSHLWQDNCDINNDDSIKIIYAGSPGKHKDRLDTIIHALSKSNAKRIHLNIYGINKQTYIEYYGLEGLDYPYLYFRGMKTHNFVIKALKASDFQIIIRENKRVCNAGFPTKFVETVSAGISVIANHFSDMDKYIIDGQNGFLLKDLSDKELTNLFKRIDSMPRNEIEIMKSSIQGISFDYRKYINRINEFINKLKI